MDGKRIRRTSRAVVTLALSAVAAAAAIDAAESPRLIDASEVLKTIEASPAVGATQATSPPMALLGDIEKFRSTAATIDPKAAAQTWFALLDRANELTLEPDSTDYRQYDPDTQVAVTNRSVLYSLPPPPAWPALLVEAKARAAKAPKDSAVLGTRLMAELLTQDHAAAETTLKQIEALAASLEPRERDETLDSVREIRMLMAELYGTRDEIAAAFLAQHAAASRTGLSVAVPDLVGLVGEQRAAEIFRKLVVGGARLRVESGDATRALARKVALERIAELRVAQWGLADSIDAAKLYEALDKRFGTKAAAQDEDEDFTFSGYGHRWSADVYYFLATVIRGDQAAAERTLTRLAGKDSFSLPKDAVAALQNAGQQEALYRFLNQALPRRPELRAWDVYIEQAAYTGHSKEALAVIDGILARSTLPEFVRADLRKHRIDALLAKDDVDTAVKALRESLKAPPTVTESELQTRVDAATRLVALGRVLSKPEWSDAGLQFLYAVVQLPASDQTELPDSGAGPAQTKERALRALLLEERKLGRPEKAQAAAIDVFRRQGGARNQYEQLGLEIASSGQSLAMTEIASVYESSGRYQDVIKLLDESTKWGARDLARLVHVEDSQGVPLLLIAARSLAATGNNTAALGLVKAVIRSKPGYDPAYELLVRVDPNALQTLDALYQRDMFEERPLIWSAIVLQKQGRLDAALDTVKRALAIDPSDGEEGVNDRMRGYAVLADILEAKGDAVPAATYRGAVTAIRISERSDELHKLGLYERAFAGYREALSHFEDAYCIQSRLAVQLAKQGRRSEAVEHYRRAYELMPASFGRVESHCFGCESVFQGNEAQGIADEVFTRIVAKTPSNPQAHYLLGYLREEQERFSDALQPYREAVALDKDYLNAWKHLYTLGDHVYIESDERDIARLRLLELDPTQRHVQYDLKKVGNFTTLWRATEKASALREKGAGSLYPLRQSAKYYDDAVAKLPEPLRNQMELFRDAAEMSALTYQSRSPRASIATHSLIAATAQLMGLTAPYTD